MDEELRLRLSAVAQPGDTLIFQVEKPIVLTQEKADEIRAQLSRHMPGIKSLFLAGGLTVGAVFREEELT